MEMVVSVGTLNGSKLGNIYNRWSLALTLCVCVCDTVWSWALLAQEEDLWDAALCEDGWIGVERAPWNFDKLGFI